MSLTLTLTPVQDFQGKAPRDFVANLLPLLSGVLYIFTARQYSKLCKRCNGHDRPVCLSVCQSIRYTLGIVVLIKTNKANSAITNKLANWPPKHLYPLRLRRYLFPLVSGVNLLVLPALGIPTSGLYPMLFFEVDNVDTGGSGSGVP